MNAHKIIEIGKRAMEIEINSLQSILKKSIDDKFVKLINLILKTKGKVFICGMGKPGYIAMKSAAGLASTGTPAFFIHPAEASHGDLGRMTKEDLVILLSNSGETTEINNLIAYAKRIQIKIVSITRNINSFIAQSSDLSIALENCPQTNPVNSPTSDTIMMQSYLDAVLTVLIEARHFDSMQFKNFHPGGKLGSSLIKIEDIMRTGNAIPLININKTVSELLKEMNDKALGCCVILNNNKLVGMVSDGDLRRKTIEYGDITKKNISDIMTLNPKSINEKSLAIEAVSLMTDNDRYRQVLIVVNKNNEVVGILHIQDFFRARII